MVRLGSGCIHWSRSLTQSAFLEWEYWWERNPQGHVFFFFSYLFCFGLFLNISNLFLNAMFCSFFQLFPKEGIPNPSSRCFVFFYFSMWKYHTQLLLPSFTSPPPHASSSLPDPSQTLGFGLLLKPVWFSFKNPFRSCYCRPQISKAMSFSSPSLLLTGHCESRGKKYKEK